MRKNFFTFLNFIRRAIKVRALKVFKFTYISLVFTFIDRIAIIPCSKLIIFPHKIRRKELQTLLPSNFKEDVISQQHFFWFAYLQCCCSLPTDRNSCCISRMCVRVFAIQISSRLSSRRSSRSSRIEVVGSSSRSSRISSRREQSERDDRVAIGEGCTAWPWTHGSYHHVYREFTERLLLFTSKQRKTPKQCGT